MAWHVGKTVGVTLYEADSPEGMIGVMVGERQRACKLAAFIVTAVNERAGLLAERDAAQQRNDQSQREWLAMRAERDAAVAEARKWRLELETHYRACPSPEARPPYLSR